MQRRQVLACLGAVGGAGCLGGRLRPTGQKQVQWEGEANIYVGQGFQPTVIVTGTIENIGGRYVDQVTLTCRLLDGDEATVDSRTRRIVALDTGETQQFVFEFEGLDVAQQTEDVTFEGEIEE